MKIIHRTTHNQQHWMLLISAANLLDGLVGVLSLGFLTSSFTSYVLSEYVP